MSCVLSTAVARILQQLAPCMALQIALVWGHHAGHTKQRAWDVLCVLLCRSWAPSLVHLCTLASSLGCESAPHTSPERLRQAALRQLRACTTQSCSGGRCAILDRQLEHGLHARVLVLARHACCAAYAACRAMGHPVQVLAVCMGLLTVHVLMLAPLLPRRSS